MGERTRLQDKVGWLREGDVVTLRVQGLGETRQTVRATGAPHRLAARPKPDARGVGCAGLR